MSGPVDPQTNLAAERGVSTIEVKEGRTARVGELNVIRVLPTKKKRTIGPWCFVDLMSPDDIDNPPPMEIGPHPHIGLSTVTWLFAGSALHSDSLGTEQLIAPGELNLMTTGHGLAHAELGVESKAAHETNGVMGAQMWLAQPESTRHGDARFEHLADLPRVDLAGATAQVIVGSMAGADSPARVDHPTIGIDLTLDQSTIIPTDSRFEHAVVPIDRPLKVEDSIVEPGSLAVIPTGYDQLRIEGKSPRARLLVLGGEPLGEPIRMWWNFVARTQEELTEAWADWRDHNDERFGAVPSKLSRIDAPIPPWIRSDV